MWIERDNGTWVYIIRGTFTDYGSGLWVIAKIIPRWLGANRGYDIWVMERMMSDFVPGNDIEVAKEKAFKLVRDICGEILSSIPTNR